MFKKRAGISDGVGSFLLGEPHLLLMNIKMQDNERRIRIARIIMKTFRLPVVFLSAHSDRELFKQIINAQPYTFITKPSEVQGLQRDLETALDRRIVESKQQVHSIKSDEQGTVRLFIFTVRKTIPAVRTVALEKVQSNPNFKVSYYDQKNTRL